ncbi:Centrosomal Protein Poc5 [Manis pentadactyla]|nr:Centrosomal Protein Poc5 [Manis pentadactyla]
MCTLRLEAVPSRWLQGKLHSLRLRNLSPAPPPPSPETLPSYAAATAAVGPASEAGPCSYPSILGPVTGRRCHGDGRRLSPGVCPRRCRSGPDPMARRR